MFPPKDKRSMFMYNDLPIQISAPEGSVYEQHPDYDYLNGRKLEDVYPSGGFSTWSGRLPFGECEILEAQKYDMPSWKKGDIDRSKGQ